MAVELRHVVGRDGKHLLLMPFQHIMNHFGHRVIVLAGGFGNDREFRDAFHGSDQKGPSVGSSDDRVDFPVADATLPIDDLRPIVYGDLCVQSVAIDAAVGLSVGLLSPEVFVKLAPSVSVFSNESVNGLMAKLQFVLQA